MTATNAASVTVDPQLAVVIDDDEEMRGFIATTLTQLGMRVEAFEAAQEAVASIDIRHPAVIFLDVALLRSDAIDVLHDLGARHYRGIVQLMSGGRSSLLEAVKRIGVRDGLNLADPLNKPFTREAIVQLCDTLRTSRTSVQVR